VTRVAVGYVRESTEEQGQQWSPDVQRKAIQRFAVENEWQLSAIYQDFVSGRRAEKRPDFQRLIADATARRFDTVICYHSSRFARNVAEARQFKDYLRTKLGIDVVSVTQRFGEAEDPSAFLMESINEVLDEHYSRNLGFLVSAGLREKANQGFLTGSVPFGYRRPPGETRQVEIEPAEAEVVRLVFERYATGTESFRTLADWLTAQGFRGRRGRRLSKESVYEMLSNATYAGYLAPRRGGINPDARGNHEPIISRELWDRAQAARARRSTQRHGTRPTRHAYVLTGTAVCGRCGGKLYGTTGGNGSRYARYLCSRRTRQKACDQPQASARVVEGQLSDFLGSFRLGEEHVQATLTKLRARIETGTKRGSSLSQLRARLGRLKDLYELGDLDRDEFLARKAKVVALMSETEPLPDFDLDRCVALLHNFAELWLSEEDPKERAAFVRLLFERVEIEAGRIVSVQPRSEVLPLFTRRFCSFRG